MAVLETAERYLPPSLRVRLRPRLDRLTASLAADGETARAQRQALLAFAIRVASAAIAFVSQIILARLMGEFEYGIFAFVWVIVVLAGNLSCLGFHTSVIRFLPQHRAEGDLAAARGLHYTARIFSLISASVLAVIGFLFLRLFAGTFEAYWTAPLFLALFTLPMIALGDVLDGTARASGWTMTALSPTFLIRPTLILLFMVCAVWLGASETAVTAMEAALAATYVTTLLQYIRMRRRLRGAYGRGALRLRPAVWLGYSLPVFLVDGIGFLLTNADVVVVGITMPPDQVAVYFAAAKTIVLVQFVAFAVKAAAAPRFAAILAGSDTSALAAFAGQTARWSFWPALVIGLAILLVGEHLLALFGPAFTAGYWLLPVLFAGILTKALVGPGEVLLSMAGRQKLCVLIYAAVLAIAITLNILLIPRYGLGGAAMATACAMMVEALLLHIALRLTLDIRMFAFAGFLVSPHTKAT
jgi:O-antigen/teichoic acid export membrane protein